MRRTATRPWSIARAITSTKLLEKSVGSGSRAGFRRPLCRSRSSGMRLPADFSRRPRLISRQRSAGDAVDRVDHQHEDPELALHDLRETYGRHVAEPELAGETLAGRRRLIEPRLTVQPQSVAEKRCVPSDLRPERPERGDEASGV